MFNPFFHVRAPVQEVTCQRLTLNTILSKQLASTELPVLHWIFAKLCYSGRISGLNFHGPFRFKKHLKNHIIMKCIILAIKNIKILKNILYSNVWTTEWGRIYKMPEHQWVLKKHSTFDSFQYYGNTIRHVYTFHQPGGVTEIHVKPLNRLYWPCARTSAL